MVAGRGKTGAGKPSYAGKNLSYYKSKKSSKSRRYDNDEEEDDDEEDFSSEGDNEEETEAESDATVDYGRPPLIKKSQSDEDEEEDDDDEDEEDDDDDDDEDDDDSGSSTDEEVIKSKIKTPVRPKLQVPKKLDVSSIRKQRFGTPSGSESPIKRESEEENGNEEEETDSNEFDPNEVAIESSSEADDMITPVKKRRATSVVEHDFDDRLAFPRSNVFDNMEGYGEYDNQTLLAMLGDHQVTSANEYEEEQDYDIDSHNELGSQADDEDDEDEDDDDDDKYDYNDLLNDDEDDDDDKLEDTEAKAIVDEMKDKDLFSNASSPGLIYDTEEFAGFEDDEEEEEEDVMYVIDDFFEPVNLLQPKPTPIAPFDEEDDSYLYSYFWTSGSEAENDGHMSAPEIINQDNDDSGEETEDELPRGGHRKSITRATEVLSSSNSASRPPTLGVWVMNNKRPFGIIDGLNTRSISPPLSTRQRLQEQEHRRKHTSSVTPSRKRGWSQTIRSDDSEMSEIALDELIYMSELDEPEDCIGFDLNATPLAQYSQQQNNTPVPLSAFRNRGIMSAPAHHFDARRASLSNGGSRRREITMTPVKSLPRKLKMRKKPKRKLHHDNIDDDLHDEHDHWNDMELATLSPLFGGIS